MRWTQTRGVLWEARHACLSHTHFLEYHAWATCRLLRLCTIYTQSRSNVRVSMYYSKLRVFLSRLTRRAQKSLVSSICESGLCSLKPRILLHQISFSFSHRRFLSLSDSHTIAFRNGASHSHSGFLRKLHINYKFTLYTLFVVVRHIRSGFQWGGGRNKRSGMRWNGRMSCDAMDKSWTLPKHLSLL